MMKEYFKKILITGGLGFIGSNFIRFWLKNYPESTILNLDKLTYAGNVCNLKDVGNNSNYQFVKGDISDFNLIDKLVKNFRPDCIVNFAAETHVDRSLLKSSDVFTQTNIVGTRIILEVALKYKVKRFHHISSIALSLTPNEKFNERATYNAHNPYSASKAASDHLVKSFYHSFNLPITITNCSNNYGHYQHPEKFIPRIITNLIVNKKIPIYGDGKHVRDWLYVEDHCSAIETVLIKGSIGETYCVGGHTQDTNNLELTKMILDIMGKNQSWIEFISDRPGHDCKYVADWSKIHNELRWEPKYEIEEGLVKTVKWYVENEWWWRPLKEEAEKFYKKLQEIRN